jgi:hypothetical protein
MRSMQQPLLFGKQVSTMEAVFSAWSVRRLYNDNYPCGGGVEYLHRDPASRSRRRKWKSQIWESKIWSRVPGTRTQERLRWQGPAAYTRDRLVLSLERAPHKNKIVTVTVIHIWSWALDGARHQDWLTDWPSVATWLTWTGFSLSDSERVESPGGFSSWEYKDEDRACDLKTLIVYNIWSVWRSETVLLSVWRSVARRRLLKTENPSACATVTYEACKSAIALYFLYSSVTKRDCNQGAHKSNHRN